MKRGLWWCIKRRYQRNETLLLCIVFLSVNGNRLPSGSRASYLSHTLGTRCKNMYHCSVSTSRVESSTQKPTNCILHINTKFEKQRNGPKCLQCLSNVSNIRIGCKLFHPIMTSLDVSCWLRLRYDACGVTFLTFVETICVERIGI